MSRARTKAKSVAPAVAAKKSKAAPAAERKSAMRAKSEVRPGKDALIDPRNYPIGRGRKNKKQIAIYMHPLAKEALDRIARSQKLSVQELGIEALNLLFLHYGEKPIA